MMTMAHGHESSVERTIRLWIAQQERNRHKSGQLALTKGRGDAPGKRPQRTIAPPSAR
jgi:hypothetical protein